VIFFELALTYGLVNLFSHFPEDLSVNPFTVIQNVDYFFSKGTSEAAIGGIGLASSISIVVNLWFLGIFLKRKGVHLFHESSFIYKKIFSSFVMLVVGLVSFKVFEFFFITNKVIGLIFFTINVTLIMGATYYFMEKLLQDEDINILDDPIRKFKKAFAAFKQIIKTDKVTNVGA
jgi:hypothetical protein